MRIPPLPLALWLAGGLLTSSTGLMAAGLPADAFVGDSFTVSAGHREAGSSLVGQAAEVGGRTWSGVGQPIVSVESNVTVATKDPAMGLLELTKPNSAMSLSADLQPNGTGFVALALLPNRSPGDFWKSAAVWVLMASSGDYEIYARGTEKLLKKGTGGDYGFKPGEFNHVELFCDPFSATVSVRMNGATVLSKTVVADLPPLVCAAFRFNENATPNEAKLDNFAVQPASF